LPTVELEIEARRQSGAKHVAGIDEAGRGAIAGPVVAAAVILPLDDPHSLDQLAMVDDSKRLSASKRDQLFDVIVAVALTFGIASIGPERIDQIGIIPANAAAMQLAVSQLMPAPDFLLIDGRMRLKNILTHQQSIIRGDSASLSIASASILAKVTRDRQMIELDNQFPAYGLGQHKGYCTRKHVEALNQYGPSEVHRYSFAPLRRKLIPTKIPT
jgi:ribonuclease HII